MKKGFLLLLAPIILLGCTNNQYSATSLDGSTQGERRLEGSKRIYAYEQNKLTKCSDSLRNSSENPSSAAAFKVIDAEVFYRQEDSPNKLALMSSEKKINKKQSALLLEGVQSFQKCRLGIKEGLSMYPTLLSPFENYYGEMDVVYSKLISGQITIGEANRQQSQLALKAKNEFTSNSTALAARYNADSNREVQAIQAEERAKQAADLQRRAIAAQYLMNQQAINAQQQINQQNQLNNQKPIRTNCTNFGTGMISCTSQ